jgi:hypothetical protein
VSSGFEKAMPSRSESKRHINKCGRCRAWGNVSASGYSPDSSLFLVKNAAATLGATRKVQPRSR